MAPHSRTLAWKIPRTEEPGGLQSMGSLRVRRLSDFTFTFHFHALEKEMAIHSNVLAWRIPGTGEPGGLRWMGSQSQTRLKQLSCSSSRDLSRTSSLRVKGYCCCCLVAKLCPILCDPTDCSPPILSLGFPRQEYWSE